MDIAPESLFTELGMLVIESRVPEPSLKGHAEGPHCPVNLSDAPKHRCDQSLFMVRNSVLSVLMLHRKG